MRTGSCFFLFHTKPFVCLLLVQQNFSLVCLEAWCCTRPSLLTQSTLPHADDVEATKTRHEVERRPACCSPVAELQPQVASAPLQQLRDNGLVLDWIERAGRVHENPTHLRYNGGPNGASLWAAEDVVVCRSETTVDGPAVGTLTIVPALGSAGRSGAGAKDPLEDLRPQGLVREQVDGLAGCHRMLTPYDAVVSARQFGPSMISTRGESGMTPVRLCRSGIAPLATAQR